MKKKQDKQDLNIIDEIQDIDNFRKFIRVMIGDDEYTGIIELKVR